MALISKKCLLGFTIAYGMKLANEVYNNLNLKFFPAGNTGNQMGGWFNKAIREVTDFKGLKFRMPGLGGEVLKSYGTNVVLLYFQMLFLQ